MPILQSFCWASWDQKQDK